MIDSVFHGAPTSLLQPSGQVTIGIDIVSGTLYYSSPNSSGWQTIAGSGGSPSISQISASEIAVGNGTPGDFTGSILLGNLALGLYSGGGQGHMGQINGITFLGDFPPAPPYGTAVIDIGILVNGTPNGSAMGVNSALAVENNTHNCFALNGQIASPSGYAGNILAGMYCVYGETDHNGSGTMGLSIGVQGQSYQQGSGHITRSIGGYFETCSGFYKTSTGGIAAGYGIYAKSGGLSGTLTNDTTIFIDSPYTGATFTNVHVGLLIADQTAGGALTTPYAIKVLGSGSYCDFGGNAVTFGGTNAGISYVSPGILSIGDGNIGAVNGKLVMAHIKVTGLGIFANNAAAVTGGLAAGDFYRTGADPDVVCVVH